MTLRILQLLALRLCGWRDSCRRSLAALCILLVSARALVPRLELSQPPAPPTQSRSRVIAVASALPLPLQMVPFHPGFANGLSMHPEIWRRCLMTMYTTAVAAFTSFGVFRATRAPA
jgi:hypothetical protein